MKEQLPDLASIGMLPVPTGHTLRLERYLGNTVELGQVLSLEIGADVRRLHKAVQALPKLAQSLEQHLPAYLQLFSAPFWRILYDGPSVIVPVGPTHHTAYELAYLLDIVKMYNVVSRWEGASELVRQLQNPTQIAATFFEIEMAAWCTARVVTHSLRFAPEVARNGGMKRPDYLWKTMIGDLVCECKQAGEFEDKFRRRTAEISSFIERELKMAAIPRLRFDFCVDRTSGAEQSIRKLIALACSSAEPGQRLRDSDVTLAMSLPEDERSAGEGALLTSVIPASTSSVRLGPQGASSTIEFSGASYWPAVAKRLISDARTQLPKESASAIMLSLPSSQAARVALPKIHALIQQPAFANTPWISVWAQGGAEAVYRNGQPFDGRLAE